MSNVSVGTLRVDLIANTATFEGGLDKAGQTARKSSKEIQSAFEGINMKEGIAGVAVFDELVGVHLPRHVRSLVAELPGIATAMSLAFPALAVIVIVEKIAEAIEKAGKFEEGLRKIGREMDAATISTFKHAEGLELDNLKLADQISKLSGGVEHNKLAEALIEARKRSVELSEALEKDIARSEELLGKQSIGFMRSWMSGKAKTSDITEQVGPELSKIQEIMSKKALATQQGKAEELKALDEELALATIHTQTILKGKLDSIDTEKIKAARDLYSVSNYKPYEKEENNPNPNVVNVHREINARFAERVTLLNQLMLQIGNINRAEEASAKNEDLRGKVAGLQEAASGYGDLEKKTKENLDVTLSALKAQGAEWNNALAHRKVSADEWAQNEANNAAQALEAHLKYFHILEAAATNSQVRDKLIAEEKKLVNDELAKALAEDTATTMKNEAELQAMRKQAFKEWEADQNKQVAEMLKNRQELNKTAEAVAGSGQQTQSMRSYIDAVLQGTDALREYNVQLQLSQFIKQHENSTQDQRDQVEQQLRSQAALQDKVALAEKVRSMDRQADLQKEIDLIKAMRGETNLTASQSLALAALQHQTELQRQNDLIKELSDTERVSDGVHAFMLKYQQDAQLTGQKIDQFMTSTTRQFSSELSRSLVEGGGNWRQFGVTALEQIAEMGIQWVISHTVMTAASALFHGTEAAATAATVALKTAANASMALSDAGVAAAGAFAFYSALLPPIAPAMAALQYAEAMPWVGLASLDVGGMILSDGIAQVHRGEAVIPEAITTAAANNRSSSDIQKAGRPTTINYSPSFTVWDKEDVGNALEEHRSVLRTMMREEAMKMA